ncbi:hypothetical protein [Pseudactinotalea sp. Z1732]|uniref:hypothetical protein n=1 Tax=Micrococcales TaxID=85006 RepID=UPI003C7E50DE
MSALLAIVALVAAWQTSTHFRTAWDSRPRVAVVPGEDGVAEANGLGASVDGVALLESVQTWSEQVSPMDGHNYWHIALRLHIEHSEVANCRVYVEDTRGRLYEIGRHVPTGVEGYTSVPTCQDEDGTSEVGDVQRFMVLIPDDAQPRYIRVQSQFHLNPDYLELPAG